MGQSRWMGLLSALAWITMGLGVSVGCSDEPEGNVIVPGGTCHELAKAQCRCCGTGEVSCTAQVDYLVVHANAVTGFTESECQTRLDAIADEATWCVDTFDTQDKLDKACQNHAPAIDTIDAGSSDAGTSDPGSDVQAGDTSSAD